MNDQIIEIKESLQELLEEAPVKIQNELKLVMQMLENSIDIQSLIKIQEHLEIISNMSGENFYIRSEILTIISLIETLM